MKRIFPLSGSARGPLRTLAAALQLLVLSLLYTAVCLGGYPQAAPRPARFLLFGLYALLAGLFIGNMEGFRFGQRRPFDICLAQWLGLGLANGVSWLQLGLMMGRLPDPRPLLVLTLVQGVLVPGLVRLFALSFRRLFRPWETVLVCGQETAEQLRRKLDTRSDRYRIQALVTPELGFDAICRQLSGCQAAVLSDLSPELRDRLMEFCYRQGIRVYAVPQLADILLRGGKTVTAFDTPLVLVDRGELTLSQRFWKRATDISLCLIALIPAAPIMALVALAIRLEDGGPVFYRQKRMTLGGREFDILKFRSMIPDAERRVGAVLATQNDPRITRVGRFIRATRLDELPQLLNILLGHMSIVGPRPERRVIAEEYARTLPEFDFRLKVRGGLTGYAQIYGKYNTSPRDKLKLDLMYIENYSLLLDLRLMLMTLRILFSKESTEGVAAPAQEEAKCS